MTTGLRRASIALLHVIGVVCCIGAFGNLRTVDTKTQRLEEAKAVERRKADNNSNRQNASHNENLTCIPAAHQLRKSKISIFGRRRLTPAAKALAASLAPVIAAAAQVGAPIASSTGNEAVCCGA